MNEDPITLYWIEKAQDDLASAQDNLASTRLLNAVRDSYFACFHAFSALLLKEGIRFKKHKDVRSIFHRDYIKAGRIKVEWGKHYDWLFENRQKADYRPLVKFEAEQVKEILAKSKTFVKEMTTLLKG